MNLNEKCALFGIFGDREAARQAYFGLFALQHRGQEQSGLASTDGRRLFFIRGRV
jgi:amidophosphoribosyltransferase